MLIGVLVDRIDYSAATLNDIVEKSNVAECLSFLIVSDKIHACAGKKQHRLIRWPYLFRQKQIYRHTFAAIAGVDCNPLFPPIRRLLNDSTISLMHREIRIGIEKLISVKDIIGNRLVLGKISRFHPLDGRNGRFRQWSGVFDTAKTVRV